MADIFMKGGNAEIRKKLYDEKKMEKGCGVALILIGVLSGDGYADWTSIDSQELRYIVVLLDDRCQVWCIISESKMQKITNIRSEVMKSNLLTRNENCLRMAFSSCSFLRQSYIRNGDPCDIRSPVIKDRSAVTR